MRTRLIALDMDGTMLNSRGRVSAVTRKAIERAIEKGIQVVIASGRTKNALPEDALAIRGLNYAITSNGSSIFRLSDSKRIYANDMLPETVEAVLAIARNCEFPVDTFIRGQAYACRPYYNRPTDFGVPQRMNDYVRRTRIPVDSMIDFVYAHRFEIEGMDFIVADPGRWLEIHDELRQINNLYITSSESYYLELANGSVSKASALRELAEQLRIPREEILAFGDGGNDIELLTFAGTGVAMKNSVPALLKAADAVTLSNDEDGIAFYLQNIL